MSDTIEQVEPETEKANPMLEPLEYNIKAPVITDEDKENFFRAFLSDEPFSEVVPIFGGKFKMKFATMTVEQNDDLLQQIAVDQSLGLAKNQDSYFIRLLLRRLVTMLVSLNGVPFEPTLTKEAFPIDTKTGDSFLVRRANILEKKYAFKLAIIIEAFRGFEKKVDVLSKEALNENFWKAAA